MRDRAPCIAVVSAFAPKLTDLRADLLNASERSLKGVAFATGTLEGREVMVFPNGTSVVNAAMTVQLAPNPFAIGPIVFSRSAGDVDPTLDIGDVRIAER